LYRKSFFVFILSGKSRKWRAMSFSTTGPLATFEVGHGHKNSVSGVIFNEVQS